MIRSRAALITCVLALAAAPLAAQPLAVVAPTVTAAPGATVDLPIETVPGPSGLGIVGMQVRMELGASVIQSSSFVTGEGFLWTWGTPARNATASFAVAAAAGTTPVPAGTDRLATVRVVIRADAPIGTDLPLTLSTMQFNEGSPAAEVTHGLLRIRTGTVAVTPPVSGRLALAAPAPSPARAGTRIAFALPHSGRAVRLDIVGVDGRAVRTLAEGEFEAGTHERVWDLRDAHGRAVAAGLYWVRLESAGERVTRRLVVAR